MGKSSSGQEISGVHFCRRVGENKSGREVKYTLLNSLLNL
jgi:hypothetical protein